MTIGGSIALLILGAILAFAIELQVAGINISAVGVILMIGGLIGLAFGLFFADRHATRVSERRTYRRPARDRTVVEEREIL
jgi:hypothetical protein